MATLDDLAALNPPALIRYEPRRSGKDIVRSLFLLPAAHAYLTTGMDNLKADRANFVTPKAAAHRCFEAFCWAEPFARVTSEYNGFNRLDPGIWELKTFDIRAIGFFWRKRAFVVTTIRMKRELPRAKLYKPFINHAHICKNSLELDPPPCVTGELYADLF